MLGPGIRWLAVLSLCWAVGSAWVLRIGADWAESAADPPVATLRASAIAALAGTTAVVFLHARANRARRPLVKALVATVVLSALGWVAWVRTLDGHHGSGPVLAVPLGVAALVAGALAGSRAVSDQPAGSAD